MVYNTEHGKFLIIIFIVFLFIIKHLVADSCGVRSRIYNIQQHNYKLKWKKLMGSSTGMDLLAWMKGLWNPTTMGNKTKVAIFASKLLSLSHH